MCTPSQTGAIVLKISTTLRTTSTWKFDPSMGGASAVNRAGNNSILSDSDDLEHLRRMR